MKVSLVVADGVHQGKVIPIKVAQFIIGRDPKCHLRPSSPSISKQHCVFFVTGDKVVLRDLGSTNGTFVNEQPLQGGQIELHNGDQLKIGPLAFTMGIERGVAVDKPTPVPPVAVAAAAAVGGGDADSDEAIAAMLLDVQGEGGAIGLSDPGKISSDSTVLDMAALPGADTATGEPASPEEAKKAAKKGGFEANTSQAAKAILEKYLRRPRN